MNSSLRQEALRLRRVDFKNPADVEVLRIYLHRSHLVPGDNSAKNVLSMAKDVKTPIAERVKWGR